LKNKFSKYIFNKLKRKSPKILLPENNDARVIAAIKKMKEMGFNIADINEYNDTEQYIQHIKNKKFTNNWTFQMLQEYVSVPLNKGLIVLDLGEIDGLVAGAATSTANVIKSSIRVIGIKKDSRWISSSFFMVSPSNVAYTFSDCGVIPEPSSEQLVSIAYQASITHKMLANEEPKIAFLSFSTKGSADHYKVKRVRDAVNIFSKKYPQIIHDGELQFDAAIDLEVSNKKIKNSKLNAEANVFIFPDLDSANIAYKITQYLADYTAWGPLLNGFNKPVNDLSRGCDVEDIINITSITALQSLLKS
tara:strand:- start:9 stop:923 length:915 start_codon:yes stop_codon:yes gene_type:complete